MIIHRIATLVLLAVLLTISQGQKTARRPTRSEVIELQPTIFQDTVYSSTDPWLLYLYAPWCEPCQEVHAEFDRVSIRLKGRVKLAKIDPSKN
jgi:thioredoxin-like negative regulator of GroEL